MNRKREIDLNCDVGESFGVYKMGQDAEILRHVSSANIACGFHAGDPNVMMKTVDLCKSLGVAIGAHPGFPDLAGFGRRDMAIPPEEIYHLVVYQVGALLGMARTRNVPLEHVKPHGALYNMAAVHPPVALAVAQAVKDLDPNLILVGLADSKLIHAGKQIGLSVAREIFADRNYEPDGTLTPRSSPHAVIHDPEMAGTRVVRMIKEKKVRSLQGQDIPLVGDTVCIHGDHPQALTFVLALKKKFQEEGIVIKSRSR